MKIARKWYWFASSFVKKHKVSLILGLVLGIFFVSQREVIANLIPIKPTHHHGRIGRISLAQLPLDIQQKIGQGLVKITPDGGYELDLAQTLTTSEDGKTYTITLKPNTTWSNGQPVHSSEIDLSLTDVTVETPNQDTLVLTLKEPFTPFPTILSQPILKRINTGSIREKTVIIGTNQYQITDIKSKNQAISQLTLESPDQINIYKFYATENEAITAYKLGKIDHLTSVSQPYLEDWHNTTVETTQHADRYLALFYNTTHEDLQNKSIRQMLAYATPKTKDDTRVISPISQNSWAYNPQVKPYHYDQAAAQEIYDGLAENNPNLNLNFELTTTPAYAETAQNIIQHWSEIGINTQLKVVAFPDTNDYQILLIGQQIPEDPDQYLLWHSTQPTNITRYQNPKIDKLLEDGRKELDKEARKRIYQDFQRFLVEDSPATFLHQLKTYDLHRS